MLWFNIGPATAMLVPHLISTWSIFYASWEIIKFKDDYRYSMLIRICILTIKVLHLNFHPLEVVSRFAIQNFKWVKITYMCTILL